MRVFWVNICSPNYRHPIVPAHPAPAHPLLRAWRHPLLEPFNSAASWDRLLGLANPAWSLSEPRARVVETVDEAPGVKSVWLKPNARFRGFRAGQHTLLELEVDGARHARCFSFSHAPRRDGLLRLTIRHKPEGPVSTAAHALRKGAVVRLGQAQGDFALPAGEHPLLMLAAGSGITPMLPMLQLLADAHQATGVARDVALVHSGRTDAETVFANELRELARRLPSLRLHLHESATAGRLDAGAIAQHVPDWARREILLCGPDGFMRAVETMHAQADAGTRLQVESFGRRQHVARPDAERHAVDWGVGDQARTFTVESGQNLLDAAEAAGVQARFGCRRGICHTCQCRKRSGIVHNQLTGRRSGPGEELIQLCISTPLSDIELAP